MPSVRYYNQAAPFWDFIANLEQNASEHPFSAAYNSEARRGPSQANESGAPNPSNDAPEESNNPPPHEGPHHHHHGFGGRHWGAGPHRGGHHGFRRGGGWGRCGGGSPGWGGWPMMGGDFDLGKLADLFAQQFSPPGANSGASNSNNGKDFRPPADVFDTPDAYIIHVSLPGAKKEDVGVNWNADKSEISVAGVIYRPGDEEFLKTLAMDEREVGVFERKIRLGSPANPANVDEEEMGAKMEDGVLVVRVPKLKKGEEEEEGFVDVKRVDIE
ncbi:MAG: hypothetical protein Q9167_000636 [Letrouitia subvulpina]